MRGGTVAEGEASVAWEGGKVPPPPFLQLAQVNLFNDDIAIVGLLHLFLYCSFQILYTGNYYFKRSRSAHSDITKKTWLPAWNGASFFTLLTRGEYH
jgi:hypothetical protein